MTRWLVIGALDSTDETAVKQAGQARWTRGGGHGPG
jgi:hypothetical protein